MSARKRSVTLLSVGVTAAALSCSLVSPAAAATPVTTVNTTVGTPFNLAVHGTKVLVADGESSKISRLNADGTLTSVANGPKPGEVAGVAFSRDGRSYAYTTTEYSGSAPGGEPHPVNGSLVVVRPEERTLTVNLATYEQWQNPDGKVSYGLKNPPACLVEALDKHASYKGVVESHPYSVDYYRRGSWVVADAGGNDLLKVSRSGRVSTLAVLPRQPLKITAAVAKDAGVPDTCDVIGKTYYTEAVPTDVEYDGGYFWVTTLPGGPEAGPRGKVYRVSRSGAVKEVASGLAGAVNLERHRGRLYVAELFAGRISVIKDGKPRTYVELPGALSVESSRGHLLAGTGVTGPGSIVRIG